MPEPPPEVPPSLPEIKQIAVCHGYGDNTADTLYALGTDGSIWVRSVRRDSNWQLIEMSVTRATVDLPAFI